jgi:hypothetical protein
MKRKIGLFLVFGAALPLAVASAAWACGVLATLTLDKKVAAPGEAIAVSGRNYSTTTAGGASPVTVRLKTRDGSVLTTIPAVNGRIADTFTLPASTAPGWYVVLATQSLASGAPKSGTPGRTTLRVQGSADKSSAVAAPWKTGDTSGPATGSAGGQSLLAILLAAALSLSMLVGGWSLLNRRNGRMGTKQPQFGL